MHLTNTVEYKILESSSKQDLEDRINFFISKEDENWTVEGDLKVIVYCGVLKYIQVIRRYEKIYLSTKRYNAID
jgi:hypothetical protein